MMKIQFSAQFPNFFQASIPSPNFFQEYQWADGQWSLNFPLIFHTFTKCQFHDYKTIINNLLEATFYPLQTNNIINLSFKLPWKNETPLVSLIN